MAWTKFCNRVWRDLKTVHYCTLHAGHPEPCVCACGATYHHRIPPRHLLRAALVCMVLAIVCLGFVTRASCEDARPATVARRAR